MARRSRWKQVKIITGVLDSATGQATSTEARPATLGVARAKTERNVEIDGIRGWAALVVLFFHVFWEMLGHVLPQVRSVWTGVFLNGGTAVSIFFILSGDALSSAFFASKDPRTVDRLLVKRYFRLTVPIFLSCLMVFLIIKLGWDYHRTAVRLVHSEEWLGDALAFDANLSNLLQYSLRDVYTNHTKQSSYNPFLWTMSIEMIGSMLVFLLCYVWDRLRRPSWVVLGASAALLVASTPYGLFGIGVLLGSARHQGILDKLRQSPGWQLVCLGMVTLALGLSAFYAGHHATPVIAGLLVLAFYTHRRLRSFFAAPLSRFLGAISFPLYLVHFPILISVMSWLLINAAGSQGGFGFTQLGLIAVTTIAVCVLAASIFGRVERFVLNRLDRLVVTVLRVATPTSRS